MDGEIYDLPLARMTRQVFDALDDASLARAAVEPILVAVRAKSPAVKTAVYEGLSPARRALFLFWIVYGHAGREGWTRLFREVPYLNAFPQFFDRLRRAFDEVGDEAMRTLVTDVARVYGAHDPVMADFPMLDPREPRAAAVLEALLPLDHRYRCLAASALGSVAARIRERPGDFIRLS